jgi:hypothetical protein
MSDQLDTAGQPSDQELRDYFRGCVETDDLELDEIACDRSPSETITTSRGADPGTWVRAWVWCYDADVQAWLEARNKRQAAASP